MGSPDAARSPPSAKGAGRQSTADDSSSSVGGERKAACAQRVGSTLKGTWKLERMIGVGGMAAVYAATRIEGSSAVGAGGVERPSTAAVKVLHPEIARSKELTRRFQQEALAARIGHPGAVSVVETDVGEDGCPFLVMELLEGESLLERMNRSSEIDYLELLKHVDQLLDVLAAAHAIGIVHRDIKLDNLFLVRGGGLKVLDFGIARVKSSSITVTGQRLGTVAYMPPEQMRGLEVDGRADLFAVGATLFRVIARRRVHVADNDGSLLLKMANEPAPPLRSVAPQAPAGVAALVDRALAYFARERYPDAQTMQGDVRALIAGGEPPYATKLSSTPPSGPSPRGSASGTRKAAVAVEAFTDAPTVVGGRAGPDASGSPSIALDATALAPAETWKVGAQRGQKPARWRTAWMCGAAALLLLVAAIVVAFLR